MSGEMTAREAGLAAALALTAHYFPRVDDRGRQMAGFREATFFAYRKLQTWSQWSALSADERETVRKVMALVPPDCSDPQKLKWACLDLLGIYSDTVEDKTGGAVRLAHSNPDLADAVILRVGGDLLAYAEQAVRPFYLAGKRRRARQFAGPGIYRTRTAYLGPEHGTTSREIEFLGTPSFLEAADHSALPQIWTRPARRSVAPTTAELRDIAKYLSTREGCSYLGKTLDNFFNEMRTNAEDPSVLDLISGNLQVLNAPTGSGKTVLMRVMASWAALNDIRITLSVTDVRTTLEMAREINADFAHLRTHHPIATAAYCTALFSPSRMNRRAADYAALHKTSRLDTWDPADKLDISLLAAGCAQRALMDPPDLYNSGEENCTTLTTEAGGSDRYMCPFVPTCGKFDQFYRAAGATAIVTNHANLTEGRTGIGVVIDGQSHLGKPRGTESISVLELVLRLTDVVLIDEIDAFQASAVASCTSELTLASRQRTTALMEVDIDTKKLPAASEDAVSAPLSHARRMAEMLLLALCAGKLRMNPTNETASPDGSGRDNAGWRLAQSRDREILQLMYPDCVTDPTDIPAELFGVLDQIMPTRRSDGSGSSIRRKPVSGVDWAVQSTLTELVTQRGLNLLEEIKGELRSLLAPVQPDLQKRSALVNLLVTRTVLRDLDFAMDQLFEQAQTLRHTDLSSVKRILDTLRRRTVETLYPLSTLRRSIHGYQIKGMENKDKDAELLSRSFGGDPHTFVAELGGLTALLEAGTQRPVMGLSATAYFPQAVEEHIFAPVRWWLPDTRPESITTLPTPVQVGGTAARIGGLPAKLKRAALRELRKGLYEQHLCKHLMQMARKDKDRARVILAVNSYEQAAWLAEGVAQADGLDHRICVLTKDQIPRDYESNLPPHVQRMVREELKGFPEQGEILIAPLAVIGRGLNIVVGTRSAVSHIYLCVRPVLNIEDTAWMHASTNAAGIRSMPREGSRDPVAVLRSAAQAAWAQLTKILRSPARFSNVDHDLRSELVAGMLVVLIQLAGRARRGGTTMTLHIVDDSLLDEKFSSDLATVIRQIHDEWEPEQLKIMNELYGQALQSFLTYAGLEPETI
jgi:hypothetical protein